MCSVNKKADTAESLDSLVNRKQRHADTDHHFVLSSQVGRLAQQLALGHSDGAGGLSNQHAVVKPHASQRRRDQVSALWPCKDSRRGVKLQSWLGSHHSNHPNTHWQLGAKVLGPAVAK